MLKNCPICGRPARKKSATYCQFGCHRLAARAKSGIKEERVERFRAVKDSWRDGKFQCHYSGLELDIFDSSSPFYFSFDHSVPKDRRKIVACAAFINDMKSDTSEEEFRHNTLILARHFKDGIKLQRSDFRLKHFRRNT